MSLHPAPLGELTALPQTLTGFGEEEGKKMERNGKKRAKKEGEGKGEERGGERMREKEGSGRRKFFGLALHFFLHAPV